MTNQTPESVIAEVIEYHADAIDTHGPGCYKNHAACLAVKLRDMLREPCVPDAATEELARIKPLFENYSREYPNECNKRVKAEAERDAALAAIERVRAIHYNAGESQGYSSQFKGGYGMLGDCCAACGSHGEYGVEYPCPTVAALEGAPESEVKPSSTVDEAALAEVIANAGVDYNLSDRSAESHACGAPDYRSAFLARAIAEHLTGGTK
ncbi:MAG: hypothetical protein WC829_03255 [Hyphomicrobium sp.]